MRFEHLCHEMSTQNLGLTTWEITQTYLSRNSFDVYSSWYYDTLNIWSAPESWINIFQNMITSSQPTNTYSVCIHHKDVQYDVVDDLLHPIKPTPIIEDLPKWGKVKLEPEHIAQGLTEAEVAPVTCLF